MTARDKILAAAVEHGWAIGNGAGWSRLTKGDNQEVYVEFNRLGRITYARSDKLLPIDGPGKLAQVLAELAPQKEA